MTAIPATGVALYSYPDHMAERLKARAGQSYRPSNGTEGDMFYGALCRRCKRDAKFRETQDGEDGCRILVNTMVFSSEDAEYPKEWVYAADGQPTCTAFEELKP
jgi:hypothetical protein